MEKKIQVAILEDHALTMEGYLSRLRNHLSVEVVGVVRFGEDLDDVLARCPVDVLILDVSVPVSSTNRSSYPILDVIPRILEKYPDLEVMVVSMYNNGSLIRSVMEAGASGYALKDDISFLESLPDALTIISKGGMYMSAAARQEYFKRKKQSNPSTDLSPRQLQALSLCSAYPEASTSELADKMLIAGSTMRNLLSGAYLHLEVHSRVAAVAKAQQLGYISPGIIDLDIKKLGGTSA